MPRAPLRSPAARPIVIALATISAATVLATLGDATDVPASAATVAVATPTAAATPRTPPADPAPLLQPAADDALLNLLIQHGVSYLPVTSLTEALQYQGLNSTLVIDNNELPSQEDLYQLNHSGEFGRIIILNNNPATLSTLLPGVTVDATSAQGAQTVAPGCAEPEASAAGPVDFAGPSDTFTVATAEITAAKETSRSCYPIGGAPSMVVVSGTASGGDIVVIGSENFVENQYLTDAGNAALALQVFGRTGNLVWLAPNFTPDPALDGCAGGVCGNAQQSGLSATNAAQGSGTAGGAGSTPPSLQSLLPAWIWWALAQLAIALLLIGYWRGRRLGRVVTEQLPVRVRAAETVEGHARLYRRAKAYSRAADLLRRAAAGRLAANLGLPSQTAQRNPSLLVAPVAARLAAAPEQITELLAGPAPGSEAELVRLADRLDHLEREVRSS